MRQIPRSILNMTASLYPKTGEGTYSVPSYGEEVSLERVHIRPSRVLTVTTGGKQVTVQQILYFDALNSSPPGTSFSIGDKLTIDGIEHNAVSVTKRCNPLTGKLHHWEVRCVGS